MNSPFSVCTLKVHASLLLLYSLADDPSFRTILFISWGKTAKLQPSHRSPFPCQDSILYLLNTCYRESVNLGLPQEQDWSEVSFPFPYYAGFHIWILTFMQASFGTFMQGSLEMHLIAMDLSLGLLTLSKECFWALTICSSGCRAMVSLKFYK